jgi:hypothetical protein
MHNSFCESYIKFQFCYKFQSVHKIEIIMTSNDSMCRACLDNCPEDDQATAKTDFQSYKVVYNELTSIKV